MDEGPFRGSRPADRRAVNRPEPAQRQQEEPRQPVRTVESQSAAQPAVSHRATKEKKASKSFKAPAIIIAIIVLAIGGWLFWSSTQNGGTEIDSSKYQAVFLVNGQIYFGKLDLAKGDYMKLSDVYYLQTKTEDGAEPDTTPATTTEQSKVQLIKLGENELHGPEDLMVISKDQVLYYENLKNDGKVVQSIEQFKKAN